MKRRNFLKQTAASIGIAGMAPLSSQAAPTNSKGERTVDQWQQLEVMMNTQATEAVMKGSTIQAVICWQATTETEFTVNAPIFVDCSGDGLLAATAGALYRTGREAASEFNEKYAPEKADGWQMGASILLHGKDMGRPMPYTPPSFAISYDQRSKDWEFSRRVLVG